MYELTILGIKPITNQMGEQFYPETTTNAVYQPDSETGHATETTLTSILATKADKVDTPQIFNASSYSTLTNEQCEAIKNGDIIVAGSGSSTNTYIVRFKTSSQLTFYGISGKCFLEICTYKKNNSVWAVNKHSSDPVLIQAVNTGQPQYGMYPNVVYNLGVISDNFTFLLKADQQDTTIAYIWHWTFSTGDIAPTITWPAEITMWNGGEIPEIEANKYYEVSVMNGVGTIISADIPQTNVEP